MSSSWLVSFVSMLLLAANSFAARAADTPPGGSRIAALTDPHLVGWWKFDELSGNKAADSSAQNHPGILEGGFGFEKNSVPGRVGGAIKLDGKEDCIRVTGFKGITGPQARTVAVWVKPVASSGEVVSWGLDDHGKMWILGFIRGHMGVTPKGGYLYMKASVQDNSWHHVAVVVHEAAPPNLHDHVQLFKDGTLAEIDDIGLLDLWPIETGDKLDVVIGRKFNGCIDDLRIYDRALSEDEISLLAKGASGEKGTAK